MGVERLSLLAGVCDRRRSALCALAAAVGLLLLAPGAGAGAEVGSMKTSATRVVHKALGGGRWFPGARGALKATVAQAIASAQTPALEGRVAAVISPHAGYVYSGNVAGYSFRALRDAAGGKPETVVVLGFTHRDAFSGLAVMDGDALETPLGEAALDTDAAAFLAAQSPRIRLLYAPHAGEHSAENQVPFVQEALPQARLVVALFGDHDGRTVADVARALGQLAARKRIAVVASTDLLHDPDYDRVTRSDGDTLGLIEGLKTAELSASWSYTNQVCCGIGPVLAAMTFAREQGCPKGVRLHYENSGDAHPESRGQWVVGYGAVAFPLPASH